MLHVERCSSLLLGTLLSLVAATRSSYDELGTSPITVGSLLLGFLPVSLQVQTVVMKILDYHCNRAPWLFAVHGRISVVFSEELYHWFASGTAGTNRGSEVSLTIRR